ncbi:MAG: hypothetical protein QXY92_05440 [Archaeoglobaceae archaeon]
MIFIILAIVSALSVPQGGTFNITIAEQSYVELDPCMFFEDAKSSGNFSPGEYRVIAGYGCEPGRKEILVRSQSGVDRILIDVERVDDLNQKIVEIQKEVISLKKQVEDLTQRRDYLQSLVAVLNDINVQLYDKNKELGEKNNMLASELDKSKSELENCSKNITVMEKKIESMRTLLDSAKIDLENCNSELSFLKNILSSSSLYLELFKNLAILALAFIVGVLLAILRRY